MVRENKGSKPKVSVIMPVHNTGHYLEDALNCLQNQTFDDFEVICVDDGSEDLETIEILCKYEQREWNFQVIHLQRCVGAGEARNIGFKRAIGDYVIFLDSDDLFETNLLKVMYERIEEDGADVCVCSYDTFYIYESERIIDSEYIANSKDYKKTEEWLTKFRNVPWNKMINKNYMKRNHIHFQNIKACNDYFFSHYILMCDCKLIDTGGEILIHYRCNREGQLSEIRSYQNILDASDYTLRHLKNNKLIENELIYIVFLAMGMMKTHDNYCNQNILSMVKKLFKKYGKSSKGLCAFLYANWVGNEIKSNLTNNFYYYLVQYYWKDIRKLIPEHCKTIGVWGCGERGRAFLKVCKEKKIKISYVTDAAGIDKAKNIGFEKEYLDEKQFLEETDFIVVSNYLIVENRKEINCKKNYIVLETW